MCVCVSKLVRINRVGNVETEKGKCALEDEIAVVVVSQREIYILKMAKAYERSNRL